MRLASTPSSSATPCSLALCGIRRRTDRSAVEAGAVCKRFSLGGDFRADATGCADLRDLCLLRFRATNAAGYLGVANAQVFALRSQTGAMPKLPASCRPWIGAAGLGRMVLRQIWTRRASASRRRQQNGRVGVAASRGDSAARKRSATNRAPLPGRHRMSEVPRLCSRCREAASARPVRDRMRGSTRASPRTCSSSRAGSRTSLPAVKQRATAPVWPV